MPSRLLADIKRQRQEINQLVTEARRIRAEVADHLERIQRTAPRTERASPAQPKRRRKTRDPN
jgi:hypothetical protein